MAEAEFSPHLVDKLQAGDEAVAAAVFQRFAARLIELARAHLDGQLAAKVDPEDVLQSVFRSFFRRHQAGQFQFQEWNDLWALLTVLTIRKCRNQRAYFRAERRDFHREWAADVGDCRVPDRDPTPFEAVALADLVMTLSQRLDERDRHVMELHLQGHTAEEIAGRIGRAIRTVRRSLERIRQQAESLTKQPCGDRTS